MVELREVDTARAVLRQTPVFNRMKQEEPDRFLKLEHLCGRTYFDTKYVHDLVLSYQADVMNLHLHECRIVSSC